MARDLSTAWLNKSDGHKALAYATKAREIDEVRLASAPASPSVQLDLGFDLGAQAAAYYRLKNYRLAGEAQRQNVALREKIVSANPADFRAADRLGYALQFLGQIEEQSFDDAAAQRDYRRAIKLSAKLRGTGAPPPASLMTSARSRFGLARLEKKHGLKAEACGELRAMLKDLEEYQARGRPGPLDLQEIENKWQQARACRSP
jgi:tetratricopeptide (TPR) repeat protein